jgi:hypothetical protein
MDAKTQLGRVPLSNSDESALIKIFASIGQGARGASLRNSFRAEDPRNHSFDHVNGGCAQGELREDLRPREKLVHGPRSNILLWDNNGISGIKAGVLKTGRKDRLSYAAAAH